MMLFDSYSVCNCNKMFMYNFLLYQSTTEGFGIFVCTNTFTSTYTSNQTNLHFKFTERIERVEMSQTLSSYRNSCIK